MTNPTVIKLHEFLYATADTAAGGILGLAMAWGVDLVVPARSSMWVAMGLSMVVTTAIQLVLGGALGLLLGQLEMMIPTMVLSSVPGMGFGMLKWAGLTGSWLVLVGLLAGLGTFSAFACANLWYLSAHRRTWSHEN